MKLKKKRYYIHGDLSDKKDGRYYCCKCGSFHPFEHFTDPRQHDIIEHLSKYNHDKKFNAPQYAMNVHIDTDGYIISRDKNAPNFFADCVRITVKGNIHENHK